ncbi:MEDS domain-containing protein [Actinomadura sp. ATCC 31491]|uniref:MEDS domain-containing protein n=1 Tax=Actinomadura luzonensis TaxID=2805427 RepID=A0ABT0G277_9ACTN|nr:MEDS domain-containing protein [Actinomadura luzonensis]MCK2218712.1 MEDS domain-containing protein [Actinomadura luzonensis]
MTAPPPTPPPTPPPIPPPAPPPGAPVRAGAHVAARFGSDGAFLSAAAGFARAGVGEGAQVLLFPSPRLREALRGRLSGGGDAALGAAARDGRLLVLDPRQVQLAGGAFDPARLRAAYLDAVRDALAAGRTGVWTAVDMDWARPGVADPGALVAFEAAANTLFTPGTLTALCAYDTRVFTAGQIFRACQAHPSSDDTAGFAHRALPCGGGLAFSGETDRSNALAWNALLASLAPGHDVVDISAMSFLSIQALADLGAAACARPRPLTIRVTFRQATRLSLLRLDQVATIEVLRAGGQVR